MGRVNSKLFLPIESVNFKIANIYLNHPLKLANENYSSSKTVFVSIKANGFEGIGEGAPDKEVTDEDAHSVSRFVEKLAPILTGKNAFDIQGINDLMDNLSKKDNTAKAGIDIALYDLIGRILKRRTVSFLGGKGNSKPISMTIGIEDGRLSVKHAKIYKHLGFKVIKLKVGLDVDEDLRRLKEIREAVGNAIKIVADANQGYTLKEAQFFLSKAEALNLAFLEQPVKFSDFYSLKRLKAGSKIPIMADESVKNIEDFRRLADINAVSMINIKLMKMGGITKAIQIAKEAMSKNIGVMVGCMEETRVGIAAGMHFTLSINDMGFADLDSHLSHSNKFVSSGIKTINGKNIIGNGYGLGLRLKKDFRF